MTPLHSLTDLAQLVRSRRRDAGWTQGELAARSGVAEKHISRIENGANEPRLSTVIDLLTALDLVLGAEGTAAPVPVADLF